MPSDLPDDWSNSTANVNVIHVPVSSVAVQMPNTLSKMYLLGQRSKVAAIESTRYIGGATPEVATDVLDGTVHRLDLSPNQRLQPRCACPIRAAPEGKRTSRRADLGRLALGR